MTRSLLVGGLLAGSILAATGGGAVADAPKVVVSIKPIHSLVAGVMAEVAEPRLLVQGAGSPHSYSLRPSDARALSEAELVFWVGEGMETFLVKPLDALSGKAKILEIADLAGIELMQARVGGAWEAHSHEGHEEGTEQGAHEEHEAHAEAGEGLHEEAEAHAAEEDEHGHEHETAEHDHDEHQEGGANLHLWLDPHNAEVIVKAAVAELSGADPDNAARYEANGNKLLGELDALDAEIRGVLEPIKGRPYVVFHDAYQYFEAHYGLNAVGSVTVSPERAPGARRLTEIREKIAEVGAACVFAEPQFEPAVVEAVIEGTGARKGVLDPLGAELAPGPAAYAVLMRGLADSLRKCLAPES